MVDWTNPAEVLTELRAVYYQRLAGKTVQSLRKDDRGVDYALADLDALKAEITRLEVLTGQKKRYAIKGGGFYPHY